jgi:hypothetical protein
MIFIKKIFDKKKDIFQTKKEEMTMVMNTNAVGLRLECFGSN